jgi:ribonuclease HI
MQARFIDLEDKETIIAYTDGSVYPNPNGNGGWAFTVNSRKGESATRYGSRKGTTNNEMEMLAIVRALQFVTASARATRPFAILTDSSYCLDGLTKWYKAWEENDWRTSNGKPVANLTLLQTALRLIDHHRQFRTIELVKVKGHSGIPGNEHVDWLASYARKKKRTNWQPEDYRNAA